jgi:PII-like signaling protein
LVSFELSKDLPPFVEIVDNRNSVILKLKTVRQNRLSIMVAFSDFSLDVCLFERFEIVVVSHAVGF